MSKLMDPVPVLRGPVVVFGIFCLIASLMFGVVVVPALATRDRLPELDDYGRLPEFSLQDQTGGIITRADILGTVVIANFIFTRCTTVCPVFTDKMHRVQDRTHKYGDAIKLVSFTVDPEYDTPEVLRAYADDHGADSRRWRFITGAPEQVRAMVTDGLAVAMDKSGVQVDGSPNIIHSEYFVLLDHQGHIRGYYSSSDAQRVETMLRDAHRLRKAISSGRL